MGTHWTGQIGGIILNTIPAIPDDGISPRRRKIRTMDMKCWNHSSAVKSRTIKRRSHLNVNSGGVDVFRSEGAEDGGVHLCSVRVTGLRRAALQREVAVSRVYERVLAQAVECVLEAV